MDSHIERVIQEKAELDMKIGKPRTARIKGDIP